MNVLLGKISHSLSLEDELELELELLLDELELDLSLPESDSSSLSWSDSLRYGFSYATSSYSTWAFFSDCVFPRLRIPKISTPEMHRTFMFASRQRFRVSLMNLHSWLYFVLQWPWLYGKFNSRSLRSSRRPQLTPSLLPSNLHDSGNQNFAAFIV